MTFTGYIRCFCATTSHELVTLTFDLLTLRVFHVQCFLYPTHIPMFIILWLSVTELWMTEFDHISINRRCYCACVVLRDLSSGGETSEHFRNPWPKFTDSLCHFQGDTTKIKPCYRRKIAFSYCEVYKVHSACAVSRDLCIVGPNTTRNNFDSEFPIHYTTFMALQRRLMAVLY